MLVHKLAKAARHAEARQYALPLCRSICSAAAAAQVLPPALCIVSGWLVDIRQAPGRRGAPRHFDGPEQFLGEQTTKGLWDLNCTLTETQSIHAPTD